MLNKSTTREKRKRRKKTSFHTYFKEVVQHELEGLKLFKEETHLEKFQQNFRFLWLLFIDSKIFQIQQKEDLLQSWQLMKKRK